MKRVLASIAFVVCFSAASNASSFDLNSLAYINQLDGAAYSRMDTAAIVAPLMRVAEQLPRVNPGPSNLALVWQEGEFNNASVDQQGMGNVGLIRQIGYNNSAAIQQSGNGHQAMIFQQGRNNTAIISQR
jgi:minor curlin subunit